MTGGGIVEGKRRPRRAGAEPRRWPGSVRKGRIRLMRCLTGRAHAARVPRVPHRRCAWACHGRPRTDGGLARPGIFWGSPAPMPRSVRGHLRRSGPPRTEKGSRPAQAPKCKARGSSSPRAGASDPPVRWSGPATQESSRARPPDARGTDRARAPLPFFEGRRRRAQKPGPLRPRERGRLSKEARPPSPRRRQ